MAEAENVEDSDDYDEEEESEECSEEGEEEDSDDYDEELEEDDEEMGSEDEEEPLPRDLTDVPCCSREVEDGWMQPREGEVARCVVIDGANIVHTGSAYSRERRDPMLDISSLLAWIRFFLVNDFEVVTVLPQRYLRKTLVLHTDILKSLNQCGLLFVPHSLGHISDDYIMLELARQCEGVVLSVDQYRDQCRAHASIARVAREQRAAPAFHESGLELREEEWFHRTQDGRHWLAYHSLEFAERRSMEEQEWRAKFFSTRGHSHELVVEQRERWSEEKRRRRLELVDSAIRHRMQRPPAYKNVITRAEMAQKLKEGAEEEERMIKEYAELDRNRREERARLRAERKREKWMDTVD